MLFAFTTYLIYRFMMALSGAKKSPFWPHWRSQLLPVQCPEFHAPAGLFPLSLLFLLIFVIKRIEDSPEIKYFIILASSWDLPDWPNTRPFFSYRPSQPISSSRNGTTCSYRSR